MFFLHTTPAQIKARKERCAFDPANTNKGGEIPLLNLINNPKALEGDFDTFGQVKGEEGDSFAQGADS